MPAENALTPQTVRTMFTVFSMFAGIACGAASRPFLCVPPRLERDYLQEGAEFTYGQVLTQATELRGAYRAAGYGHGHRIAVMLENRPEYFAHFLALNSLGVSVVPLNPDYRIPELRHVFEHCEPDLVVGLRKRLPDLQQAVGLLPRRIAIVDASDDVIPGPRSPTAPAAGEPNDESEALLLYTSGTTGKPKGCIITNRSLMASARFYAGMGGSITYTMGQDRLINPLPLYHMGGFGLICLGMMIGGNCIILLERFRPDRFWRDAIHTRATAMHYLGVVPSMLLAQPERADERQHTIRFATGGGAPPDMRARFLERFGIPLTEGWAMTETGRSMFNNVSPFHAHRAAIGRPGDGLEARVVDDNDLPVPAGRTGELCVRWGGPEGPRWGFFGGYLKNPDATEQGWRGGWWHSGDLVEQDPDGTYFFVDRKKHIVRRSGENIAAAEVEAVLAADPEVDQVAVLAAPDALREEEVLACIVLREGCRGDEAAARRIFDRCNQQLAYHKTPGWILFMASLPMTGTQKIAKPQIFPEGRDPRDSEGIHDLRNLKRRHTNASTGEQA